MTSATFRFRFFRNIPDPILFRRANAPDDDRVHELEMARVEAQREVNFFPGGRLIIGAVPHVVLHVAPTPVK